MWSSDSSTQPLLKDKGPRGLNLTLGSVGLWKRPVDSVLTHSPKGRIFYEAQIYLTAYPPTTTYNKAEIVMGIYGCLQMAITSRGQLAVVGQRGPTSWTWYGVRSVDSAVPRNRWVKISVGADDAKGELYAWIDGVAIRLWSPTVVAGTSLRPGFGTFALGGDPARAQTFTGRIATAKVYSAFPFAPGAAPGIDATIDD